MAQTMDATAWIATMIKATSGDATTGPMIAVARAAIPPEPVNSAPPMAEHTELIPEQMALPTELIAPAKLLNNPIPRYLLTANSLLYSLISRAVIFPSIYCFKNRMHALCFPPSPALFRSSS